MSANFFSFPCRPSTEASSLDPVGDFHPLDPLGDSPPKLKIPSAACTDWQRASNAAGLTGYSGGASHGLGAKPPNVV